MRFDLLVTLENVPQAFVFDELLHIEMYLSGISLVALSNDGTHVSFKIERFQ